MRYQHGLHIVCTQICTIYICVTFLSDQNKIFRWAEISSLLQLPGFQFQNLRHAIFGGRSDSVGHSYNMA
jgi:hypothetical protein